MAMFFFCGAGHCGQPAQGALFVSVLQEPAVLASRTQIRSLVDYAGENNIETLYVQVYRANQSWFPSAVADSGPYEQCYKQVGEDPVALLLKEAHARGIKVHGWFNLLSLSANKRSRMTEKYGAAILTRNIKEKRGIEDYKIDGQYFLEPGDLRVRSDLVRIVGEALARYPDLDGILFDYIRYPDKDPAYGHTEENLRRFREATGPAIVDERNEAWRSWKRQQVTQVLESVVKKARTVSPGIRIGATGCAPFVRAYDEAFQDWPSWLERGLVDSVTVMTYAGSEREFEKLIEDARKRVKDFKKANLTVGAYGLTSSPEVFAGQIRLCRKAAPGEFVILHYGNLQENQALTGVLREQMLGPG
jgi:uncharacterized lipoprotein YddW (UPF0748 family)